MVDDAQEIVQRFLSLSLLPFEALGRLPTQQGVYAIYAKDGSCLHVGKSNAKGVLGRVASHLSGGGKGAGGDLVQKVLDRKYARTVPEALAWMQNNCLVKGLAVEDNATRGRVEVLLTRMLQPCWRGTG